LPCARTAPLDVTTRHATVASKTDASPAIVRGGTIWSPRRGDVTVIEPLAEVRGDGFAVGASVNAGVEGELVGAEVGAGLAVGVGTVTTGGGVPPHAPRRRAHAIAPAAPLFTASW
jgi:hypothetical protein